MEKIGDNIFVETVYPGVNVGCIITDGGSICVDTPLLPGEAQRWRALIRSLEGDPVRMVIYTDGQRERILGTQYLTAPYQSPSSFWETAPLARDTMNRHGVADSTSVVAHNLAFEKVKEHCTDNFKQSMIDMLGERDPDIVNLQVILPQITLDTSLKLYVGDEEITVLAAAKGMLWVWLPEQGALFTGDTVVVGTHPPLIATDTKEWLSALARLRRQRYFQDSVIVPGRGHLCDISATEPLTRYLRIARDRTRRLYRAGRPKADLNNVAADLLSLYPVADGQRERVQRQIKMGLDEMYDTFKAADINNSESA